MTQRFLNFPGTQVERSVATDPWGLEQRGVDHMILPLKGDNIYELNTYSGAEAASRKLVEDVEGESKCMRRSLNCATSSCFGRLGLD